LASPDPEDRGDHHPFLRIHLEEAMHPCGDRSDDRGSIAGRGEDQDAEASPARPQPL
jgi:hypothetical protein